MRKRKISLAVLFLVMMCVLVPMNGVAEAVSQNGLEVELTTDREAYNAGDTVLVRLSVRNSLDKKLTGVMLENLLPAGCVLKAGSQAAMTTDIGAGERVTLETSFLVDGVIALPSTGDSSSYAVWCALLIAAIVLLAAIRAKGTRAMLALFLCASVSCCIAASPQVVAAVSNQMLLKLSRKASCAGRQVEFAAEVRYVLPEMEYDEAEVSFADPDPEHIVHDEGRNIYYVDHQILLTANEDASRLEVEQLIASLGGRTVGAIVITGNYQVEFERAMTYGQLQQMADRFRESSLICAADVHCLIPMASNAIPNDEEWTKEEWSADFPEGKNWGVEAIDAIGAWNYRNRMQPVRVGVIDGAVDQSHEDLSYEKTWNNNSSASASKKGHGTHVSGIIAARYNNQLGIAGIAPSARLYAFAMTNDKIDAVLKDPDKSLASLMRWNYAVTLLVQERCRVINVSQGRCEGDIWRREWYDYIDRGLTRLRNRGYDFLIVQSAGNDNVNASENGLFVGCTANRDRILVVGSIGTKGSSRDGLLGLVGERVFNGYAVTKNSSWGSNWGSRVDIVAPGENILSTYPGNKYKSMGGTSMAAPHVTGVAALCFAVNPNLTGEQVKRIIVDSASDEDSVSVSHRRNGTAYSYPVLDAADAVEAALAANTGSRVIPTDGIAMGSLFVAGSNSITLPADVAAYRVSERGKLAFAGSTTVELMGASYTLMLDPGRYYFYYHYDGYLPHITANVDITANQITFLDDVFMIEQTNQANGSMDGVIVDAVTGRALKGAKLTFYPGWGNLNEVPMVWEGKILTCETDKDGIYHAELPEGTYTAFVEKSGYVESHINLVCLRNNTNMQNGALSPLQGEEQYRIVLTWGETPSDLDSHLTGDMNDGSSVHVYYSSMKADVNGSRLAELDVDDTTSYGPETITIYLPKNGSFHYAVHDYTNRNSTTSKAMGLSGAKVTVYKGNKAIASYSVPNQQGTVWNVFELRNGSIYPVNTMGYTADPGEVGKQTAAYRMRRATVYHEDDKDYN